MPPCSHAQGQVVAKIICGAQTPTRTTRVELQAGQEGLRTSSTLAEMALGLVECVYCKTNQENETDAVSKLNLNLLRVPT